MTTDFPADLPIDTCPQCREEIEYEKNLNGLFKYHVSTGGFLCPEDPKPKLTPTKRTK